MLFDTDTHGGNFVFDAEGRPILVPIRGDTETGRVECHAINPDGSWVIDEGKVAFEVRLYRAPLRLEPITFPFSSHDYCREHYATQAVPIAIIET